MDLCLRFCEWWCRSVMNSDELRFIVMVYMVCDLDSEYFDVFMCMNKFDSGNCS